MFTFTNVPSFWPYWCGRLLLVRGRPAEYLYTFVSCDSGKRRQLTFVVFQPFKPRFAYSQPFHVPRLDARALPCLASAELTIIYRIIWGSSKDVPLVEFIYLVFTRMQDESYKRRLGSLLLCLCDVFQALIDALVCWFCTSTLVSKWVICGWGLFLFHIAVTLSCSPFLTLLFSRMYRS